MTKLTIRKFNKEYKNIIYGLGFDDVTSDEKGYLFQKGAQIMNGINI